jgi:hypothetical protein
VSYASCSRRWRRCREQANNPQRSILAGHAPYGASYDPTDVACVRRTAACDRRLRAPCSDIRGDRGGGKPSDRRMVVAERIAALCRSGKEDPQVSACRTNSDRTRVALHGALDLAKTQGDQSKGIGGAIVVFNCRPTVFLKELLS